MFIIFSIFFLEKPSIFFQFIKRSPINYIIFYVVNFLFSSLFLQRRKLLNLKKLLINNSNNMETV